MSETIFVFTISILLISGTIKIVRYRAKWREGWEQANKEFEQEGVQSIMVGIDSEENKIDS